MNKKLCIIEFTERRAVLSDGTVIESNDGNLDYDIIKKIVEAGNEDNS